MFPRLQILGLFLLPLLAATDIGAAEEHGRWQRYRQTGRISCARRRLHHAPRRKGAPSPAAAPCRRPSVRLLVNITPDRETGIGKWTAEDFYKAMHNGRFPDGGLMYPARRAILHEGDGHDRHPGDLRLSEIDPPVSQKNRGA